MLRALALGVVLTAFGQTLVQLGPQAPPSGTVPATAGSGVISGVVIDGQTNAPLADVLVSLDTGGAPAGGLQTRQLTDSKGRFAFVNLPGSEAYILVSTRAGYMDAGYSRFDSFSSPIFLKDDEWFSAAKIAMWKPGAMTGAVVDEHGEPLAGVFVRVLAQQRIAGHLQLVAGPILTTDDRGVYRAAGLVPGRYVVEVPNVASSVPASTSPAVISGVSFQTGPNAQSSGRPSAPIPVETALDLDPRARLMVGRYPTPPPPSNGQLMGYSIAFYPNAPTVAQATAVELKHGEERGGIDVRLEPAPVSRISGTVQGPGDALANLTLRLVPAGLEDLGFGSESATALVAPDGTFVFLGVPAGTYTIDVPLSMNQFGFGPGMSFEGPQLPKWPGTNGSGSNSQTLPSAPQGTSFTQVNNRNTSLAGSHYWARQSVIVNGRDEANVAVTMHAGVKANGQIVLEYDPKQPRPAPPTYYGVTFDPASGRASMGMARTSTNPDAQGWFEIADLMFGQYFLRVTAGLNTWMVKSIVCSGHDYTHSAFDTVSGADFEGIVVTLTNAAPAVSGTVTDSRGALATVATVVAFPVESALWTNYGLSPTRIKMAGISNTGVYRLSSLPAGDYFLVAITGAQPTAWHDPEFFTKASATATRVTVGWGDKKTVDLKIMEVR